MRDDHSCVVLNVPAYRKKIQAVVPRYQTMDRVHYLGVVLRKNNLLREFRKLVGGLQILLWHTNKWEEGTSETIAMSGHIRASDHGLKYFIQEGHPLTSSPPIRLHLEEHHIIAALQAANTTSLVVYIDFQSGVNESVGARRGTCRPSQRRPPSPPLPPPQEIMEEDEEPPPPGGAGNQQGGSPGGSPLENLERQLIANEELPDSPESPDPVYQDISSPEFGTLEGMGTNTLPSS